MIELLLEILGAFLIEWLPQIILEAGFEWRKYRATNVRKANAIPFYLGVLFIGALFGIGFTSVYPQRIITRSWYSGISVIVSPLIAGLAMRWFGEWRKRRGHQPTELATFWGGALFALGIALVRWLKVGG